MEVILIAAAIVVQIIMIVKFFQIANNINYFRKEYKKIKVAHRLGEYSKTKGEYIFSDGEKAYSEELETEVEILTVCKDGSYYCQYRKDEYSGTYDIKKIQGDKLKELPKE